MCLTPDLSTTPWKQVSSPKFGSPDRDDSQIDHVSFTVGPRKVKMALAELGHQPGVFKLLSLNAPSDSDDEML